MINEFFLEEARRNPYPYYSKLREHMPVFHDPVSDFWMILSYQDVKNVLSDSETYGSRLAMPNHQSPDWLVFTDPPRHRNLRALVSHAFTAKTIASLEPELISLTRTLLEEMKGQNDVDVVQSFSRPLPIYAISKLVGIPDSDRFLCKRWSDTIMNLSQTMKGGKEAELAVKEYQSVRQEMLKYLRDLSRFQKGEKSFLHSLIEANVEGHQLSFEEIVGFFELLLSAGHETTTNLIGNALLCLDENPLEFNKLKVNLSLLSSTIEEVLRYRSPVQAMFRMTKNEVRIGEVTIPKEKLILPMIGSANRDPKVFKNPERFEIEREPNSHIAFGYGIHFCIGAVLARMEARIALDLFLREVRSFSLVQGGWAPHSAFHIHGPREMRLSLQWKS